MADYKQAVEDANVAVSKRVNDKFYKTHKLELEQVIQNYVSRKASFIREIADKAQQQVLLKKKLKLKRRAMKEESKSRVAPEGEDSSEEEDMSYPEECRVLDIMKEKYHDAVQFFNDTQDKKQCELAVKEYQSFCYLYDKMARNLEFDPSDIEDEIYNRLEDSLKHQLSDSKIIKEINVIRRRRAQRILEDDDVNILNFQMFQYALKLFQKEKKKEMKAEEEREKKKKAQEQVGKP